MNPIYNLRHKIQMLKDFLQLLSTGLVTISPFLYKKNITFFFFGFVRSELEQEDSTRQYNTKTMHITKHWRGVNKQEETHLQFLNNINCRTLTMCEE